MSKRTALPARFASGAGALVPVARSRRPMSSVPGASVSTPRARRTLSQNLYGLAVETTTAGVPSPLRARYSRRTREATAVCVSIR